MKHKVRRGDRVELLAPGGPCLVTFDQILFALKCRDEKATEILKIPVDPVPLDEGVTPEPAFVIKGTKNGFEIRDRQGRRARGPWKQMATAERWLKKLNK